MPDLSQNPIWVTGAGGLIGSALVRSAPPAAAPRVIGLARETLDLLDFAAVRRRFEAERPAAIIHCAAMSRSPQCQAQPALARRVNVDATALLAELAGDIPFLFFSTDLVFDGRKGNYVESDAVHPLSLYAETKAAAETIVRKNPLHTVIRASLNGGQSPKGGAFNEELRALWAAGKTAKLFVDEFRSPLPAAVTARAAWELFQKRCAGLFHLGGAERLSRWEIGQLVAARWPALHPKIERASRRDYAGPPRPPDTSLDCAKARRELSFPLPGLRPWLEENPDESF